MKGHVGNFPAIFAAIVLLFPSSASVLCIAPGGHVAIEDLNCLCCESSNIYNSTGRDQNDQLTPAKACQNCTDFFMSPNRWGGLLRSSFYPAGASSLPIECFMNRLAVDQSSRLDRQGAFNADWLIPVSNPAPLRR